MGPKAARQWQPGRQYFMLSFLSANEKEVEVMARKIQKTLSLILALSMSMSLLSVTAFAEGSEEPTVTEPKSEFSAPAGEDGSGDGTAESPTLTVKEDTKVDEGKLTTTTTTTTEKEWTGTTTPDKGDEVDDKTTTSTTVTGQETTEESKVTTNFTGTTLKESGSTVGSQTTTTTETTTKTDTAKSDKVSTSSTEKGTESNPKDDPSKIEDTQPKTEKDLSNEKIDGSVDFTGTTITVTPGKEESKDVTAPITDAQRDEALKKLAGSEDPETNGFTADSTTGTYTKTEDIKDAEGKTVIGSTTTTIVPVYDEDGKTIIGYTKTVSSSEKTSHDVTPTKGDKTPIAGSASTSADGDVKPTTVTRRELSGTFTKPDEVADVINEDGSVTKTTIEPITERLNEDDPTDTIVGYKVTTVTELDGKTIATTSKSSYASITTTTTVTTPKRTDTKYEQVVTTVTTDVYKKSTDITTAVVKPGSGTVTVTMDKVTNNSKINDLESLKPQDGLRPANGQIDSNKDLYGRANGTVTSDYQDGYDYQWEGAYGLESTIRIEAKITDGSDTRNTWQPHQFELIKKDSDDRFYTYCADYTTDAKEGAIYNMINVEDATYFIDDSATGGLSSKQKAEMVRTIAMTGYWGTDAGTEDENGNYAVGSLEQLKKTLREDPNHTLTEAQINALTDGQALTATQAAIWKFGNSGEHGIDDSNVVGCTYIGGKNFDKTSDADKDVVNALYKYLISLQAKEATHDTTILNENTVKGADVALKTKNEDGTYQANLSFTLAVTPSTKSSEDLTISIYQDGKVIGTKKLDGDCTFTSSKDGNVFTFENVTLSNGAKIELKLTGTHVLDQGVYLYSAASYDKSQTFVGVATGSQNVDISTSLTINFSDPDAKLEMSGSTEEKTRTEASSTTRTDIITESDFFNEIETTETTVTETQLEWASSWENIIDRNTGDDDDDDDDDDDNTNGDDDDDDDDDDGDIVIPDGHVPSTSIPEETIEIPDEIPTTNVPKTGDASVIWYILSACSGIGLAGTTLLGKKRRSDDLED